MHTIQPHFKMFKQLLTISNISLQNIQDSYFFLFPPESNAPKISDLIII